MDPAEEAPGAWREPAEGLTRSGHLLNIGFWLFFGTLMASRSVLPPFGAAPPYPLRAIGLAYTLAFIWAVLTPPLFWLSGRLSMDTEERGRRLAQLLGIGVVVAAGVSTSMALMYAQLMPPPGGASVEGLQRVWLLARRAFPNDLMIYLAIVAAGTARDYSRRYQQRQEEAVRLQAHTAQLQAQLAEARLAALRSKLNPHFLFNTLNAVSALVEEDPKGVRKIITRLSRMLRHALDDSEGEVVTLGEELTLLQPYLEILEIRYQGRLATSIHADESVRNALIPRLVLQPLIENAVKHGVGRAIEPGHIEVRADCRDGRLHLEVEDTGAEPDGEVAGNDVEYGPEGVGLSHTRERLVELYGSEQSLRLRRTAAGGTIAEISLPRRMGAGSARTVAA